MDELDANQVQILKRAFDAFDREKKGVISTDMIGTILEMIGTVLDDEDLKELIVEYDEEGTGELEFQKFCSLAARFMTEEMDEEALLAELREAFRLYDREGNGYITTEVLKEIFKELDNTLSNDEIDNMITEIDTDGSGTVDFDEFLEVMTGE